MGKLRILCAVVLTAVSVLVSARERVIVVKAGDAGSLLEAIDEANRQNADSLSKQLYILIPDGLYDLGERTLTTLTGHNISLIGQSMAGTIIKNTPPVEMEGISKTATIRNMASGIFLQDLTLQNALDYYHSGAAGRAVCYHDKGTRSILNRVRMLSYQDTYYTDNVEGQTYLLDAEIHGTIDFICGAGDVFFDHCLIVTEPRNTDGTGEDVIAAPRTLDTPWGYIFSDCTIESRLSKFLYARGWQKTPHCVWLNTTLLTPDLLLPSRFDPQGMRTINSDFREYHTTDLQGNDITPSSNIITFTLDDNKNTVETVISSEEAAKYQLKNVFPKWRPEKQLKKLSRKAEKLKKQYL